MTVSCARAHSVCFFILGFAYEPVEQEHQDDSADEETEGSENGCVVERIGHDGYFIYFLCSSRAA